MVALFISTASYQHERGVASSRRRAFSGARSAGLNLAHDIVTGRRTVGEALRAGTADPDTTMG